MSNAPAANQRPVRRSRRNRRNRQQPATPPNRRQIRYVSKLKYEHSVTTPDGMLILSTRKRPALTAAEKIAKEQEKKRKCIGIQTRKVESALLRHKVVALWQHGMFMADCQFEPESAKDIIKYFQRTYPRFENYGAAKSFVYRAIKNHKKAMETPHLNPQRDRRGEKRTRTKRDNPRIIELVDEFLSEHKATAPKVKRKLQDDHGFTVSLSTIHRIAKDLHYRWTKPWHTDVLTAAQMYKRKLFCEALLLLTPSDLLNLISTWMWTDEKWWDVVGPASSEYVKAASDAEAKLQNQVIFS